MNRYVIDFTKLDHDYNFWNLIKKALDLPDWCGNNPDALWDMLTGYIDVPAKITVIGIETLPVSVDLWRTWFREALNRAAGNPIWQIEYEEIEAKK